MTTADLDGCHIEKVQIVGPVLTLPQPLVDHCPAEVTFTRHWATAEQIQEKLHDFWEPRWWKTSLPTLSDWQRVLAFNAAHLPQIPPHHDDIGLDG